MDRYFALMNLPGSFVLTCLMSLLALVLAVIFRTPDRWLCLIAMMLSSVGDILLMNFRNLSKWLPNYFYVGAIFFMLAHIFYILAFSDMMKRHAIKLAGAGAYIGILLVLLTFFIFTVMTFRSGNFNPTLYAIFVVYLIIIGANCCTIFSCCFGMVKVNLWRILGVIGALSFYLSDCIIGLGRMGGINTYDHLIWWLYPIGQILILIAG